MNRFSKLYFCFILFCFLFISYHGYSQQSVELPSITPPSPTAYQMTQYGDVPVNESTGKISPSIPLFTYKAGHLQLPISLNYQGNGVKVDQAASWTGINWNLSAGGVITRIVRDEDDFNSGARAFHSIPELNNLSDSEIVTHIVSGIDSEVDEFHFSFNGYSGSFYLSEDLDEAYLTKYDQELHIEIGAPPFDENGVIQQLKREIVITDPKGIKYYFGGLTASEASKTIYPQAGGGATQFAQTAFYLHKIESPLGDKIYLVYDTLPSHMIKTAVSESYNKLISSQTNCPEDISPPSSVPNLDILHNRIENEKVLSRIYSDRSPFEVIFTTESALNNNVKLHYINRLTEIVLKNANPSLTTPITQKRISLSYIFPFNGQLIDEARAERFFLSKVTFYVGESNKEYDYRMVYNAPEDLPRRFDFDQDHLGYYNGKNNVRMLPRTDNPSFLTIYNTLADKSPDFEFSSKGVLKELYYPTGGYTKFEYESEDPFNNSVAIEPRTKNILLYKNYIDYPPGGLTNRNPQSIMLPSLGIQLEDNPPPDTDELVSQNISVRLTNIKSTGILDFHSKICLKVYNETDGVYVISECGRQMSFDYGEEVPGTDPYLGSVYNHPDHTFEGVQVEAGKQYRFELEIFPGTMSDSETIYTNVVIDYNVRAHYSQGLGIRVKRITDYSGSNEDNTNQTTNIKRYHYSLGQYLSSPRYLYGSEIRVCCGDSFLYNDYTFLNLISSSISTLYNNRSNQTYYGKVSVSHGGDGYEMGGVTKEFILVADATPYNYLMTDDSYQLPLTRENKSVVNGMLKKETVVVRNRNELFPLKETVNSHSILVDALIPNNITKKNYESCINPQSSLYNLYLGIYNTYSYKVQLDSVISKSYDYGKLFYLDTDKDGNPDYNDPDANGNGMVDFLEPGYNGGVELPEPNVQITKTTYEYNQHVGMPTKETVSTSTSEETIETTYTYPSESTLNSTYISEPLRIQKSKKVDGQEIPLSSILRVHSSSGAFPNYNGSKNLLSKVNTVKGPEFDGGVFNLEERITYHDYDSMGNPIEVSKTDGTHIVYIWGYNQTLPIAKIENATYCYNGNNYSQSNCLEQTDVENLQLLSNQDIDSISEENLRVALNGLRNSLTNSMVTTYTYDPLIGVTSMTDPRGQVVYYEYDEFNRLEYIKDKDGYILSKNDYRYQTQN